jgi:adenine-specific DNA glycosylase
VNDDRWLLEQRPPVGRWAGMWQFVTIEANEAAEASPTSRTVRAAASLRTTKPAAIGRIKHGLTHRRYEFDVFRCETTDLAARLPDHRTWARLDELDRFPLPNPHLAISRLLGIGSTSGQ